MNKRNRIILPAACILLAAALSACQSGGATPEEQRAMASLTPAERDRVGRLTIQKLRSEGWKETRDVHIRDIRYRSSDSTFVYDIVAKNYSDVRKVSPQYRRQAEQEFKNGMRRDTCRNAAMRDLLVYGRYAVEYRIYVGNGKMLAAPVRITGRDC